MKYDVTFKLTSPDIRTSYRVNAIVDIYVSGCFSYGNGKGMHFDFSQSRDIMGQDENYDIRYDSRYKSSDEEGYIKKFIANKWSGEYESWKASDINIEKR